MPTYEYICDTCKHEFEEVQSIKAEALTVCPECGAAIRRKITGGGGFILRGPGFYATDNRSDGRFLKNESKPAEHDDPEPNWGYDDVKQVEHDEGN